MECAGDRAEDARPLSEKADWELQESELAMRYGRYGKHVITGISLLDPDQVNYQLVADLICSDTLYQMRGGNHGPGGGHQQGRYGIGQGGNGQNWQSQQQRARGGGNQGRLGMQGHGQMHMTPQQQQMMMMQEQQQRGVQQGMGMQQGMMPMGQMGQMGQMGMQNMQDIGMMRQGIMQGMQQSMMPGMQGMRQARIAWICRVVYCLWCFSNHAGRFDLNSDWGLPRRAGGHDDRHCGFERGAAADSPGASIISAGDLQKCCLDRLTGAFT